MIPDFDMDAQKDRGDFFMCSVDTIAPNRYQPRTDFNEEELERLKESIAEQGCCNRCWFGIWTALMN